MSDEKPCPYCAENIKKTAKVCRYCHMNLDTGELVPGAHQLTDTPASTEPAPSGPSEGKKSSGGTVGCLVVLGLFGLFCFGVVSDSGSPRAGSDRTSDAPKVAKTTPTIWVVVDRANVRSSPDTSSPVVETFTRGRGLKYVEQQGNWYRLEGEPPDRWIHSSVAKSKQEQEQAEKTELKAGGWWQENPGIYVRWCKSNCPTSGVIGDGSYWIMEVWCKERSCGDIYGQINVLNSSGAVVGWTNDSGYGDRGARVYLTFQKSGLRGRHSAKLVKFNTR